MVVFSLLSFDASPAQNGILPTQDPLQAKAGGGKGKHRTVQNYDEFWHFPCAGFIAKGIQLQTIRQSPALNNV